MRATARLEQEPPVVSNRVARPRGIWVIYDEPNQFGSADRFVARKFLVGNVFTFVTDDEFSAATLKELRGLLPAGLVNIGRSNGDPRSVIETWA